MKHLPPRQADAPCRATEGRFDIRGGRKNYRLGRKQCRLDRRRVAQGRFRERGGKIFTICYRCSEKGRVSLLDSVASMSFFRVASANMYLVTGMIRMYCV